MALIPYAPPPTFRPLPFCRRCRFLSIPFEIRLIIYEFVFRGELYDLFPDHIAHPEKYNLSHFMDEPPKDWTTPLQLLLVCKQIHNEVAACFYKNISLEYDLDRWISALNMIGPRYGALIKQVEIVHECCERHRRIGDDGAVWNCLDSSSEHKKYSRLFECLASNNVCPGYLKIRSYTFIAEDNDNTAAINNGLDPEQNEHSHHEPYHDQKFINQLSSLCKNIRRIEFDGLFNPLWALALSKNFNFLIKLEHPFENIDAVEPSSAWTLINPKSVDLSAEFRGYEPLASNSQVYIKLPDHLNYARKRGRLIMGRQYAELESSVTEYRPGHPKSSEDQEPGPDYYLPDAAIRVA
ncbi:uncharacterized protein F4807DRAFT_469809 [Annulohypoxylon truncatum]|uniref:uncharacterized protein n=1 Tax=Annulohypoxylon truncatum TaxID=327061 RepID=UPI0020077585|nr:uncharacterized protein F4807DRAFT_469809 [Annulohypoxylon truncatum]KAI1207049.1 hypothetical protein F4807DRAFT_469809 [Annulohypoxylon truncatum]